MITRRRLLQFVSGLLLGASTGLCVKRIARVSDVHYKDFIPGTRVLLDGQDVSACCWRAVQYTDGTGVAYLYVRGVDGSVQFTLDGKDVQREVKTGCVQIQIPSFVVASPDATSPRQLQ